MKIENKEDEFNFEEPHFRLQSNVTDSTEKEEIPA